MSSTQDHIKKAQSTNRETARVFKILLLGIILLTGIFLLSFATLKNNQRIESNLKRELLLRGILSETLTILQDAETGQRGFILTSKEAYLTPYNMALERMPKLIEELKSIAKQTSEHKERIERIRELSVMKFAELSETIGLHRKNDHEALMTVIESDRGKLIMDDIRVEINSLITESDHDIDEMQGKAKTFRIFINILELITLAGIILIFYYIYSILRPLFQQIASTNDQLKQKQKELKLKNEQLEHFAHIASHDLNEPLRTISSFVEIINEEYDQVLDNEGKQYLQFITRATDRMKSMIDGLLNFSRIGKSSRLEKVDTLKVIQELEKDLSLRIQQTDTQINVGSLPVVNGYKIELRQLFQNLILNAIKFTKKKPLIKIDCVETQTHWQFCVADNGIGINEKQQEKIFGMFSKLHRSTEYSGHGIGLAFCQRIVDLHQGEIWLESIPNEGSRFFFTLIKNPNHEN